MINTLYEDRSGVLWIGTARRGLNRYDRATSSFAGYMTNNGDSSSISNSEIRAIYADKSGVLWVGTNHGLNRVNSQSMEFTHFFHNSQDPGSLSHNSVGAICEDRFGTLWIGTGNYQMGGGGLNRFDRQTKKFIHFVHDPSKANSLSDDWVTSIYEDTYGALWIATNNGLDLFDRSSGSFVHYRHDPKNPNSLSGNYVKSICEDQTGALWIGTWAAGLNRLERSAGRFAHWQSDSLKPNALRSNNVVSIYRDRSGLLWVGTSDGGVYKVDQTTGRFFGHPKETQPFESLVQSLSGVFVSSVCTDKSGSLWIGTFGAGLKKYTPGAGLVATLLKNREAGMRESNVECIIEDRAGMLWVGTQNGLYEFDPARGTLTRYVHDPSNPNSLGYNFVRTLYEDPKGDLLVGTSGGGLEKFDRTGKIFIRFLSEAADSMSLYGSEIRALVEDRYGFLWIGTPQGLCRYDSRENKVMWYYSDTANVRTLYSNSVTAIHEDAGGTLWVTSTGALHRFDRATNSFVRYSVDDGLLNMDIAGILEDSHGRLWLGTIKGLSSFDSRTERFRNYDMADGLQGVSFTRAHCRDKDGVMFFGRMDGLTVFQPDSLGDDAYLPPIAITSFKKFEKDARLTDEVRLTHSEDFFSFDFTSLDFRRPARNQYAYKLEGFDEAWIYSGSRHYAAYTHLDPGTYVFRIKGSNSYGVWNEDGTSIAVIITPPFWKTWWFTILFWMTIAGSTGGSIRYIEMRKLKRQIERLKQERALERERLRISSDLHDELASNLSSIAMLSKIAQNGFAGGNEGPLRRDQLLGRIMILSQESVNSIRDIIWAIDAKKETLEGLLTRLSDMIVAACRGKNIHAHVALPASDLLSSVNLPPDVRQHLWLLLKEAVNNAIKHSGCTDLSLCVDFCGGKLKTVVKDNGSGFDRLTVANGRGMATMKMRAEKLGAQLQQSSGPAIGTEITILMKM